MDNFTFTFILFKKEENLLTSSNCPTKTPTKEKDRYGTE
jgi:hypothetical protein